MTIESHILKHEPWNLDPSRANNWGWRRIQWSLWTKRAWPFHELAVGDTLICVSGGGPARGVVMFESEIDQLVTGRYTTLYEAWSLIVNGMPEAVQETGLTRREFLDDDYTVEAPTQGWLLAWSGKPERWLGVSRPAGFRFRPNGWAKYEGALT